MRLAMEASAENVPLARQAVTGFCEAAAVPRQVLDDTRLAVTEACTNVLVHAYLPDTAERPLEVEASIADGALELVVRDAGRGMGVFSDSGGLGLGIPLITALATSVSIRAGRGGRGTEVVMRFDTTGESSA
jgi:anti-sigma regulatory factor (Ser/Thr protein kinase)